MRPVIGHNRIRNLLPLGDLRQIQGLSVFANGFIDIAPLENLTGLQSLSLDNLLETEVVWCPRH
ncbi:hypothetical protein [Leptolyngbya sp. PCC 6406]|uniref:hypothetical protein n=1 Tax=Leptolyngbya sp. PCC 6406 TaxID=1173264 RepID=UPI0002ABF85E|nr:hypothetical protein [Leptolyngbya sp. PCC 6406]